MTNTSFPISHPMMYGSTTNYWNILSYLAVNGPTRKGILLDKFHSAESSIKSLSWRSNMIAATPDGWALTQKGKDYVAHYAPEVASRSGKPMVVINTTAPQPMQKNVITSVSHNKLTMGMPTKGGRPTKYWTLLNLINKAGSLPLDEINERGQIIRKKTEQVNNQYQKQVKVTRPSSRRGDNDE